MVLKKTEATLDELVQQEGLIKNEIRELQKQQKQIRVTRKAFERLTASMPPAPKKSRRKSAVAASA
jgi:hypothetical protein